MSTELQHVIPVGDVLTAYSDSNTVPEWLTIAPAELSTAYSNA